MLADLVLMKSAIAELEKKILFMTISLQDVKAAISGEESGVEINDQNFHKLHADKYKAYVPVSVAGQPVLVDKEGEFIKL